VITGYTEHPTPADPAAVEDGQGLRGSPVITE
jgi:hypothetical protein